MEQNKNNKMPKFSMNWIYVLVIVGLVSVYLMGGDAVSGSTNKQVSYTEFKALGDKGYASRVIINKDESTLQMYVKPEHIRDVFHAGTQQTGKNPYVKVEFGSVDQVEKFLDTERSAGKFKGDLTYENRKGNDLLNILINFGPILFIVFLWVFFMRRMGGGGAGGAGGVFNVGKSKAKMYEKGGEMNITFKDVAGQAGAKQEVQEIVEFLKNPKKYTDLGGKIPKGALLVGPPGTGKTLLAKGRARSKSPAMGGNDERENTLNALLTEMDGFGTNSGVIILAATNRADMLDSALLRAGRFDRQINVDLPDLNERKEIFQVHLKPVKTDPSVDIDMLARQTPGFSGADIANVCNEAALIAARHNKATVEKQDFLDAVDRIIGGLEKKTKVMTANEKRTIALHEAGHATISWFLEHANPLVKVSIVPRGRALGAAWYMPEERQITTKEEMLDEMCATLGGRAAEELFTGHISTGAMNDLERVTKSAYGMIAYAGMSDMLPNICYYNNNEYNFQRPYSETTAKIMDDEVLKMINEQYQRAKALLTEHQEGHNQLAELLIEKEVIFAEDVEKIFGKRPWQSRSAEIMEEKQKTEAENAEGAEKVEQQGTEPKDE